jgi:hypothetical protein
MQILVLIFTIGAIIRKEAFGMVLGIMAASMVLASVNEVHATINHKNQINTLLANGVLSGTQVETLCDASGVIIKTGGRTFHVYGCVIALLEHR